MTMPSLRQTVKERAEASKIIEPAVAIAAPHRPKYGDQDDAQADIDGERQGIDEGADVLVAGHGEKALAGADRGAGDDADDEQEQQRVAGVEARAEQHQHRLAEHQHHEGHEQRRPEGPGHGLACEHGELLGLAMGEGGIALGDAGLDREIDEMHQRQRLDGGEIDRDVVGLHVEADHQHVGVGEQEEEALDQEDRQRHHEPFAEMHGAQAGRQLAVDARRHADKLGDGGGVGGEDGHDDRRLGVGLKAGDECRAHEDEDQHRAHQIGRRQREDRPAVRPRQALQHVGQRDHRQADEAEHEGHDVVALDVRREQPDRERADAGDRRGGDEHEQPGGDAGCRAARPACPFRGIPG